MFKVTIMMAKQAQAKMAIGQIRDWKGLAFFLGTGKFKSDLAFSRARSTSQQGMTN